MTPCPLLHDCRRTVRLYMTACIAMSQACGSLDRRSILGVSEVMLSGPRSLLTLHDGINGRDNVGFPVSCLPYRTLSLSTTNSFQRETGCPLENIG